MAILQVESLVYREEILLLSRESPSVLGDPLPQRGRLAVCWDELENLPMGLGTLSRGALSG